MGGLGHLALQYAKITGATVAASTSPTRNSNWPGARRRHRDRARKEDPGEASGATAARRALALAVNEDAFSAVYKGLRRGGKLVMVAMPAHNDDPGPDLRDRAQRHLSGRLHRRHPSRPRRGVRTPPARTDQGLPAERSLAAVNDAIEQVLDGSAPEPRTVFAIGAMPSPGERVVATARA